jgi:integrase/recombinase XerD
LNRHVALPLSPQAMAAHESPRTTKIYDRTGDEITLDEVERIAI